jgi:predicted ArsR family transcriptional regulator
VNELAETLNLTGNAVRSHLTSLERDGLVQQVGLRPGSRKPHALYALTKDAESLFPSAYSLLLSHVMGVLIRRLPSKELRTNLREVGRTAAQEHHARFDGKTRDQRIEVAVDVLKGLGGDATFQEVEGKRFIRGNGCPLSAATADYPEACLITEALLSEIIDVPVKERCYHGTVPRCCFEIA